MAVNPRPTFVPQKAYLNPAFESYKLVTDTLQLEELARFDSNEPEIGRVLNQDSESRLGWREAKSKANHNFLCMAIDEDQAAWLDTEGGFWLASWTGDEVCLLC